jgi:hypothetical protein
MKTSSPALILLISSAILLVACGSAAPRSLQTVSITPASADARNFPNGEVQFAATGYYNKTPMQTSPLSTAWGACYQDQPTTDVTITPTGVAQCSPHASGTYLVWALARDAANASCNPANACGGGCGRVTGTALLTCP